MIDGFHHCRRTIDRTKRIEDLAGVCDFGNIGRDSDDTDLIVLAHYDAKHPRPVDSVSIVVDAVEQLDVSIDDVFLVELRPSLQVHKFLIRSSSTRLEPGKLGIDGTLRRRWGGGGWRLEVYLLRVERIRARWIR